MIPKFTQHESVGFDAVRRWVRLLRAVFAGAAGGRRAFRADVFERAVAACDAGSDDRAETDRPIFLLATGWRTGSTLLQRILMSDPKLMLWGEPYGRMALLPRLTDALSALNEEPFWKESQVSRRIAAPHAHWIANAYPTLQRLRRALRSLFLELLARPASELGYSRWGMKEVRCDFADARVLHWLFPAARFLVVTRNPLHCYRSSLALEPLWYRWPDGPVDNPLSFARHWNRLVCSWRGAGPEFPWVLIKFEDLANGAVDFDALRAMLDLEFAPEQALQARVGGSGAALGVSPVEAWVIRSAARRGMRFLGYD